VKNLQKWIIVAILLSPVLLGVAMLLQKERGSAGSALSGSLQFKRIGLVEVRGTISESEEFVRQLQSLRLDNSIAGVILRIDSPGGAVAPSQEIYTEVMRYRIDRKPLVVSMSSVAASGGYYIASPASKIFADPGTLTGSIGVIFTLPQYQELAKKIGIEFRVFKAGALKDVGSPYRAMTDEEKKFIERLLKDTHEQFIADVAKGRGMSPDTLARYADGRVFTGKQAYEAKLVDTLGGYEDALDWLRLRTGLSRGAKVVRKKPTSSRFRDWLDEESSKMFPFLQKIKQPAGLYYLMSIK
jgi:protease-4